MILEDAHKARSTILRTLTTAIASAFSKAEAEPQLVARAVYEIPKAVNSTVCQSLFGQHGAHVSAGGMFVHARPRIKPVIKVFPQASPASVEIGDLLVLIHHRFKEYSASTGLLLQAKLLHRWPPDPENKNQHCLYARWPEFEYIRSGSFFNGKRRAVVGPLLYSGAKYLIIPSGGSGCWAERFLSDRLGSCCSFTGQPTQPNLSGFRCFAEELYDLLFHNAGRPYIYRPGPSDIGWNRVITDLIDGSADAVSKFMQRTPAESDTRSQGVLYFLVGNSNAMPLSMSALIEGGATMTEEIPPNIPVTWDDADDEYGSGVSILSITITDQELRG